VHTLSPLGWGNRSVKPELQASRWLDLDSLSTVRGVGEKLTLDCAAQQAVIDPRLTVTLRLAIGRFVTTADLTTWICLSRVQPGTDIPGWTAQLLEFFEHQGVDRRSQPELSTRSGIYKGRLRLNNVIENCVHDYDYLNF
jgi:hypothetical protein